MIEAPLMRLSEKLEKLDHKVTRLLAVLESRDRECARHENSLANLNKKVGHLEINQAKIIGGATILSVVIGYILKGLGVG
ncbi:MAG: hypothetical protein ACRCTY_04075 [Candidatus Adiutrix sp.]